MQPELKKAFENTFAICIIDNVPDMPDHVFSKQFEKKMKHLIKYGESVSKRKITVKKLFICITAAVIAATIMAFSVGAIRDFFKDFFNLKNSICYFTLNLNCTQCVNPKSTVWIQKIQVIEGRYWDEYFKCRFVRVKADSYG